MIVAKGSFNKRKQNNLFELISDDDGQISCELNRLDIKDDEMIVAKGE